MEKIKESAVENSFYSGNKETLNNQIEDFAKDSINKYTYKTRAVIVPHAGLIYSGRLAYEGISQLDKNIKNIFIFAPAHKVGFHGLALSSYEAWNTPFGNIEVNQDINNELINEFSAKIFDEAHKDEHAIEVQLPIIQKVFENVKIIPIVVGNENPQIISKIIEKYYPNADFGFVISSDLSHFLTNEQAIETDSQTAQMIETGNVNNFRPERACGAIGIIGLVEFANSKNFSLIRIDMINSSLTSNDKSRVVGYGCWFLYEGEKNQFIKEFYSKFTLSLCRNIITSQFNKNTYNLSYPAVFEEFGACFVTLKENNSLRGCIGSILAHKPLIGDLVDNAKNAAFKDYRFKPVEKEELDKLEIDVSLLSIPRQMTFKDEQDLLNQIVPFKDGLIIKEGPHQAVYLPSVWEDLPNTEHFLRTLKMKAGLSPDYFSETFEVYRFETEYIQEVEY